YRQHRKTDEGERLRVDPQVGSGQDLDAVQHDALLADAGGRARRRRREEHVHVTEELRAARSVPGPEPLRLYVRRRGHESTHQEAIPGERVEILGPSLEIGQ